MGKFGDKRLAKLCATFTAILGEKQHQVAQDFDVCPLDHLSPPLLRYDEISADEDREVTRKSALREARGFHELAGSAPVGLAAHQTTERIKPRRVRERRECL